MLSERQCRLLDEAFHWCCRQRKRAPPNADIWHLWFHWPQARGSLKTALATGTYRLSAMQVVGRGADRQAMWCALNAFFVRGGYSQHPDKTFIGRMARGFDWMGVQFNETGKTGIACRARANHAKRRRRLYERACQRSLNWAAWRVRAYEKRWNIWRETMLKEDYGRTDLGSWGPDRANPCGPRAGRQPHHHRHAITAALLAIFISICHCATAGAADTTALPCNGSTAIASGWAPTFTSAAAPTSSTGVNPPYAYLGTITVPPANLTAGSGKTTTTSTGTTVTCTPPTGTRYVGVAYGIVPWAQTGYYKSGPTAGSVDPRTLAFCAPNAVVDDQWPQLCERLTPVSLPALTCVGGGGAHTATPSLAGPIGNIVAVTPCTARADGTVTLSISGVVAVNIYSASPGGQVTGFPQTSPNQNKNTYTLNQNSSYAYVTPFLAYLTAPSTDWSGLPRTQTGISYAGDAPMVYYDSTSVIGHTIFANAQVSCTVYADRSTIDLGTYTATGAETTGATLGAPTNTATITGTCSGMSAALKTVFARARNAAGQMTEENGNTYLVSSNDSVGFGINTLDQSGTDLVSYGYAALTASTPGVTLSSLAADQQTFQVVVAPYAVALGSPLLPGRAKADAVIDLYVADGY